MSADEKLVAAIVPNGATGTWIGLSGASLYIGIDGTARIEVAEEDMAFVDDRQEGPDGPEGGVYWVCRLSLGEIETLRDTLNGVEFEGEKEVRLSGEIGRLEYEVGRLSRDFRAEQEKSRRLASALKASEAKIAALAAERDGKEADCVRLVHEKADMMERAVVAEGRAAALTAENATLREKVEASERDVVEWRRAATDRLYMMEAYHAMLGPVALEVVSRWKAKGVKRQHTSWGPEAFTVSGEQRAQWILDWENAPKRRCIDIDKGIYEDDPPHSGQEKTDLRAALRQEGKP